MEQILSRHASEPVSVQPPFRQPQADAQIPALPLKIRPPVKLEVFLENSQEPKLVVLATPEANVMDKTIAPVRGKEQS